MRRLFQLVILGLLFLISSPSVQALDKYFDFPDGLVWFNTDRPIKMADLKGKFIVVFFWNHHGFSIANVVDHIDKLKQQFPAELVVVSVHVGDLLDSDQLNALVAQDIGRFSFQDPVVIDRWLMTMKAFRADQFPCFVLLAPDGRLLFRKNGDDGGIDFLARIIRKNLPKYAGKINTASLEFVKPKSDSQPAAPSPLTEKLSTKVLSHRLLGDTRLDDLNLPSEDQDDFQYDSAIENLSSDDDDLPKPDALVSETKQAITVDLSSFAGQRIVVNREYSQKIRNIKLRFRLPDRGALLKDQTSFVRLLDENDRLITQSYFSELHSTLKLNTEVISSKLKILVVLYYFSKSQNSGGRIKNLLFEIPLVSYPQSEDILIEHEITGASL